MGKFVWLLLVVLLAYFSGSVIGAPGYLESQDSISPATGMKSYSRNAFPDPEAEPAASENAENKESAPQAEAVRDEGMSQQQLKQAMGKHLKSLDKIDRSGNDEDYVPWALGWMQSATGKLAGQRKFGI